MHVFFFHYRIKSSAFKYDHYLVIPMKRVKSCYVFAKDLAGNFSSNYMKLSRVLLVLHVIGIKEKDEDIVIIFKGLEVFLYKSPLVIFF